MERLGEPWGVQVIIAHTEGILCNHISCESAECDIETKFFATRFVLCNVLAQELDLLPDDGLEFPDVSLREERI